MAKVYVRNEGSYLDAFGAGPHEQGGRQPLGPDFGAENCLEASFLSLAGSRCDLGRFPAGARIDRETDTSSHCSILFYCRLTCLAVGVRCAEFQCPATTRRA